MVYSKTPEKKHLPYDYQFQGSWFGCAHNHLTHLSSRKILLRYFPSGAFIVSWNFQTIFSHASEEVGGSHELRFLLLISREL